MRLYEAEKEFIQLEEGEVCLEQFEEREITFWKNQRSEISFPNYHLTIKFCKDQTPYSYAANVNLMTFVYKGFCFYPNRTIADSNGISILKFLNELKSGDADLLLKELIVSSLQINSAFVVNATIGYIEDISRERDELKSKLEAVKAIL